MPPNLEAIMKIDLLLGITDDSGASKSIALGTADMKATPSIATLGLSLANGKAFLAQLQTHVVAAQVAAINARHKACPVCQSARRIKDYHQVCFRSLFGNVRVRVPRFEPPNCQCHLPADAMQKRQRWISAELEFVQNQLAGTLPYARSAQILSLLMPVAGGNAASTVREHLLGVGRRLDTQGLQATQEQTSSPDAVNMTSVGLDSGYVRHCDPDGKQDFEVVAGRALRADLGQRSIAFVRTVDDHANQRIKALLAPFSTTADNMAVFTDGDNQLRQWQLSTLPGSKHILDWYHLRQRVSKLSRVVHSKETARQLKHADHDRLSELVAAIQWRLWHGRSCQAIRKLEIMQMVLGRPSVVDKEAVKLIRRLTKELLGYLTYNRDSLPNYGQRYRAGKRISSSFIESAVNQLIDKRMSKSQQMRWDPVSAHLLLQVRVRVVDGMLRDDFERWYEGFPSNTATFAQTA
jgi:hypothetical protein